jgi:hypothetical protein
VSARDIILPSGVIMQPGSQLRFSLVLAKPAPASGVFVTLASSDTSKLTVLPTTLIVPEGATTAVVQPLITAIDFGTATLTASAPGLTGDSQVIRIGSASGFIPANITITGAGKTQNLLLTLTSPAPAGGLSVSLSSSNTGVATVPSSVTIPANLTSISVPVTSVGAGATVIHASAPPALPDTTATVNVVTSSSSALSLPANVNVPLGQPTSFPITLGAPAPPGGLVVTLSSSDTKKVTISSATFFIPEGATSPTSQPVLNSFNIGTVAITASAPGFASVSQNVNATATVTFSPTTVTIPVGGFARVLLSLSAAAPPGDSSQGRCTQGDVCSVTVNLSSDNPSIAYVQPSISYFPDGSSQAINQLPITGLSRGTTVIHAGMPPYIPDATITVIVQ